MQPIFKIILLCAAIIGVSSFTEGPFICGVEPFLKVKVSGVKGYEGNIHILLFDQAVGFPTNPAKAYKHIRSKVSLGEVSVTIENVPFGTYAIVSFHDRNSNEIFDKSWFGSPKEDYGFSNIPGEYCGTPSFQQTSFRVDQGANEVEIKLINVE